MELKVFMELKFGEEQKKILRSVICALFSIFPFALRMQIVDIESLQAYSGRFNIIFNELRLSCNGNSTLLLLLFLLLLSFYKNYFYTRDVEMNTPAFVLAGIYSLILLLGGSFYRTASWKEVFGGSVAQEIKAGLFYTGTTIICYFVLTLILDHIESGKQQTKSKYLCTYSGKGILITWLLIILCWLPYLIVKYPGIMAWDTAAALKNYFDKDMLNNGVPVFTVLYFSLFIRLGDLIGSHNNGMALFVCIQSVVMSGVLAYFISYLERCGVVLVYRIVLLMAVCVLPLYPYTAMQMGSDVPYTITVMIYTIFLIRYTWKRENIKWGEWVFQAVILLMISLFRHTGVYITAASMILLLFMKNSRQKRNIFMIHMFALGAYVFVNSYIVPNITAQNAAAGSAMLNLTRQQVANYVILYDDLTEDERQILDKIVEVDAVREHYNPELSDDIWSITNKSVTTEETADYLKLWFKLFFRHPDAYIQAAINMWYGYFYPDYVCKTKFYVFYELHNISDSEYLDIRYPARYAYERELAESWKGLLYKVPLISTFYGIGIYTWMMIFTLVCVIWKRRWRFIALMTPCILTLLICMMSPVCGYTRYAFPIMFIMPFIMGLWFTVTSHPLRE